MPVIRPYIDGDLDVLVGVECGASRLFTAQGLLLPPDEPAETFRRAECVWVAGEPPVGYAAVETIDDAVHLGQLSVHPDHGRQGIGTRLLETVIRYAELTGSAAVTLTTFRDVAWNAPWYRDRGFITYRPAEWGPDLRRLWQSEVDAGIVIAPRIAMRLALIDTPGAPAAS